MTKITQEFKKLLPEINLLNRGELSIELTKVEFRGGLFSKRGYATLLLSVNDTETGEPLVIIDELTIGVNDTLNLSDLENAFNITLT